MSDINAIVDAYEAARKAIFDHVGYVEDWVTIPLDDNRERFWRLNGGEGHGGELLYADSEDELRTGEGKCYSAVIYTQRFLPKWVYRGPVLTLVCADTQCDGNKFLFVLDNAKERQAGR